MFQLNMFELGSTGSVTQQGMTPLTRGGSVVSYLSDKTRFTFISNGGARVEFVSVEGHDYLEQVDSLDDVAPGKMYVSNDSGSSLSRVTLDLYFSAMNIQPGDYIDVNFVKHTGTDIGILSGGNYTVKLFHNVPTVELPFFIHRESGITVNGTKIIPTVSNTWVEPTSGAVYYVQTYADKTVHLVFSSNDVTVGDTVCLTFTRRATWVSVLTVLTTGSTARGSLTLTWPVMSSGTDCTQNVIIGFYHMKIPRVMVTQRPSLDTSRSTAATPQIVFSAIDAHRGDKKWYDLVYEPLDDGMPITEYGNEPFVWEN